MINAVELMKRWAISVSMDIVQSHFHRMQNSIGSHAMRNSFKLKPNQKCLFAHYNFMNLIGITHHTSSYLIECFAQIDFHVSAQWNKIIIGRRLCVKCQYETIWIEIGFIALDDPKRESTRFSYSSFVCTSGIEMWCV